MSPCGHAAGIGTQVLITGRTSGGNVEDLILHILIAGGVLQTQAVVEEVQVKTGLEVVGVLRLEVAVILHIVGNQRRNTVHGEGNRSVGIHTAAIGGNGVVILIVMTGLTNLGPRSTELTVAQEVFALQSRKLGENPAERYRGIEERAVLVGHRRNDILTTCDGQVEHVLP